MEETPPGEYVYILNDPETMQPVVRIPVLIDLGAEFYRWSIASVLQVSGFDTAKAALDSAWSVIGHIIAAIVGVGLEPTTDRVLAVLRLLSQS